MITNQKRFFQQMNVHQELGIPTMIGTAVHASINHGRNGDSSHCLDLNFVTGGSKRLNFSETVDNRGSRLLLCLVGKRICDVDIAIILLEYISTYGTPEWCAARMSP